MAGDALSVAPDKYKVLLENDRVRVLETVYGPGQASNMHSHPDTVAIFLTAAKGKFTLGDGQTVDFDMQPGQSMFVDAQDHTVENTGASELRAILVELK